jgi:hypothetical protein
VTITKGDALPERRIPFTASLVLLDLRQTWWTTLDILAARGSYKDPYYRTKGEFWPCAVDEKNRVLFTRLIDVGSGPERSSWYMLAIDEKLIVIDVYMLEATIPSRGSAHEFYVPDIRTLVNEAWKVAYPERKPLTWRRTMGDVARESSGLS